MNRSKLLSFSNGITITLVDLETISKELADFLVTSSDVEEHARTMFTDPVWIEDGVGHMGMWVVESNNGLLSARAFPDLSLSFRPWYQVSLTRDGNGWLISDFSQGVYTAKRHEQ